MSAPGPTSSATDSGTLDTVDSGVASAAADRHSDVVSPRTAILLLAVVVLVWGGNWPVTKIALEDISPMQFVTVRLALGLLAALAITAARGQLHVPDRGDLPIIASTGILQIAVGTILITGALVIVPPGRSAVIFYTTPIWVTPGAVLVLHERLTRVRVVGLLAGLAGIAMLFNPADFDWTDGRLILGNGMLIGASIAWAIQMLHVRSHRWRSGPLELLPWQVLTALVIALPLAVAFETGNPIDWNPGLVAAIAFNGLLVVALCYWAFVTVNRALPAVPVSVAVLAIPVVGVFSSILTTGEVLTPSMLAGLGLIGTGLAVMAVSGASEARADRAGTMSVPVD